MVHAESTLGQGAWDIERVVLLSWEQDDDRQSHSSPHWGRIECHIAVPKGAIKGGARTWRAHSSENKRLVALFLQIALDADSSYYVGEDVLNGVRCVMCRCLVLPDVPGTALQQKRQPCRTAVALYMAPTTSPDSCCCNFFHWAA